jgi:IS4 transposase
MSTNLPPDSTPGHRKRAIGVGVLLALLLVLLLLLALRALGLWGGGEMAWPLG